MQKNSDNKNAGNLSLLGGRPCLDFVNSLDWRGTEQPVEFLHTYQDLVAWCRHVGTLSDQEAQRLLQKAQTLVREGSRILQDAIKLREIIYRIFVALADGRPAAKRDLEIFNQYFSETMKQSRIINTKEGYFWDTAGDKSKLDCILNPIIRSAADLMVSGERHRVKKCGDPACGWLFLDTSRNKSRRWCDMSDCGNRAKASRFYKKSKKSNTGSSSSRMTSSPPASKPNLDRHLL
jgi:predicted RNA-binding Zn ribbon-like protein